MFETFSKKSCRRQNGFTLLEVALAISILALMITVVYGTLTQIMTSKKLIDDRREIEAVAHSLIHRLSREIQLATSTPLVPPRGSSKPPNTQLYLRGEKKDLRDDKRSDSLQFMARGAGQYFPDGSTQGGLVQISYRLAEDPDKMNSNNANTTYLLVREQVPFQRPFDQAYQRAVIFPVAEAVVSLRFRYYDARRDEWYDTWGEDGRFKLPTMIEFVLVLRSPSGALETIRTRLTPSSS